MQHPFYRLRLFLRYLLKARHRKGHGIHSPFLYEFVIQVLNHQKAMPECRVFLDTRKELLQSNEEIRMQEIGAGSSRLSSESRRISDMVLHSSVQPRFGKLLVRIARYYKPHVMIELGTSLGMSALCMASGNPEGKVITLEGVPALCEFASGLFREKGIRNIEVRPGKFEESIPDLIKNLSPPELVFIDGNHSYEATLDYFGYFINRMEQGILIFDDINWSPGMQRAWQAICRDERSVVSIDLHRMGIIFPDRSLTRGHYVVWF